MGGFNPFKPLNELFEEAIEKPFKKVAKETGKVLGVVPSKSDMQQLEVTPEVTPEVVPDETILASKQRRRQAGKKLGGAGTIMEGYGVAYATPSSKSPTGGSA
tara:strand:+ start:673 stop:981 length:309 start_codon:yes stop_codon:yes gene_type:complete